MRLPIILILVCITISSVTANFDGYFYYGSPALGTFSSFNSTDIPELVYDTSVSRPTSICLDNSKTTLYFSNFGLQPFISNVETSGKYSASKLKIVGTPPAGVVISATRFDETNNKLFFMYRELNPNKKPILDQSFDVIKSYDFSTETLSSVYSVNLTSQIPTSFDIDPTNQRVYFTTNGFTYSTTRKKAGIFSVPYSGSRTANPIYQLTSVTSTTKISSLQYDDSAANFYYILSDSVDSTKDAVVYQYHNGDSNSSVVLNSTSVNPQQIAIFESSSNTGIWLRENGDFYCCLDVSSCNEQNFQNFTVNDGDSITDFTTSSDGMNLYYVDPALSVIINVDILAQQMTSVANGISSRTSIWATSSDDGLYLYYAAFDRIDLIIGGTNWRSLTIADFIIDQLTGDASTGTVYISGGGGIYSVDKNGDLTKLVSSSGPFAVFNGQLYYATSTDNYSIYSCSVSNCDPSSFMDNIGEAIISIAVDDTTGDVSYATDSAIFDQTGSKLVTQTDNIMPFALSYSNSTLYTLDINEESNTIYQCDISNCFNTMSVLLSTPVTQNYALNAWMVIDPSGSHLFWTTSSSTIIYYIEIATKTQNILVDMATYFTDSGSVNQHINGIGISSNGTEFYVSDGISTIYRFNIIEFTGSHISNCVVNSAALGDIDGSSGVFLWSDAGTGSIYECNNDCSNCNTSVLIDTNDPSCSPWQFITVSDDGNTLFNQFGCGGIKEAFIGNISSVQTQTVKTQALDPIADLTIQNSQNTIINWALPYRFAILQGTIDGNEITDVETIFTGTGTFNNLIYHNNVSYWIDTQAQKIMQSTSSNPTDLVYQPAAGLSFVSSTPVATSPTGTPTTSITPSKTPIPSANVTTSPTPTSSVSHTASTTTVVANSTTPTQTPTASNTNTGTRTGSVTRSPSATPSSNSSLSSTGTLTSSTTLTATPSHTTTATLTPTSNSTGTITPTGTITVSYTWSGTPTDTPSNTATPSATKSFNATVTPSRSRSRTNIFYGSNTNTAGLPYYADQADDSPVISRETWEWIGLATILIIVLCVIPCLYCCWKRGVEREMALSLRLLDD